MASRKTTSTWSQPRADVYVFPYNLACSQPRHEPYKVTHRFSKSMSTWHVHYLTLACPAINCLRGKQHTLWARMTPMARHAAKSVGQAAGNHELSNLVDPQVGAAAAFMQNGAVPWARMSGLVTGAILIIAWLNLSNDAFDAATGVDKTKAESIVNLTGNLPGVFAGAFAAFVAGGALLSSNIAHALDPRIGQMLAVAIACGYVYQGPPFR